MLEYFISPLDAISDAIPVIGQLEDWALLVTVLGANVMYNTDVTKAEVRGRLHI